MIKKSFSTRTNIPVYGRDTCFYSCYVIKNVKNCVEFQYNINILIHFFSPNVLIIQKKDVGREHNVFIFEEFYYLYMHF